MAYSNTQIDGLGTPNWLLSNAAGALITRSWTPSLQSDEALNDSDKTFTVPASTEWKVQWIWVELTTTAVVGNREIVIEIQDNAADVIARIKAGIVQAASLTRYYLFAPNVTELTAFRGTAAADTLSTIMPEWVLPAAYVIRVYDIAAVDAAADDLIIQMGIGSRSV